MRRINDEGFDNFEDYASALEDYVAELEAKLEQANPACAANAREWDDIQQYKAHIEELEQENAELRRFAYTSRARP
jgi:hypothetical protein